MNKVDKAIDKVYEVSQVVNDILHDMECHGTTPLEALKQLKAEFKSIDLRTVRSNK
jgi:hypothetical protein